MSKELFGTKNLLNRVKSSYRDLKSEKTLKEKSYATGKLLGNTAMLGASVSLKVTSEVIKRIPDAVISQSNSTIKESKKQLESPNISKQQKEHYEHKISIAEENKNKAEEYKSNHQI